MILSSNPTTVDKFDIYQNGKTYYILKSKNVAIYKVSREEICSRPLNSCHQTPLPMGEMLEKHSIRNFFCK